jgi:sulfatase maturation enzyme AslB (radical SAM superfamily)
MQSKTYCVMPHIGMSIQNNGDLCVCNRNDQSLKNDQQEIIFIHKDSLRDSWASPTRKMIVDLLDSGQGMPQNQDNHHCQGCYDYEQAGQTSPRQSFNELFKDVISSVTQPRVLIIKPGNVCNLACRMCNPETSSSWYTDAYKIAVKREGITESFAKYTKNFEHIRNGFNKDNINFWRDLAEWLPGLVFLDIYGGEPFLSKELFDTLDKSPNPENTSLQLHTNVTIYNEKYLEILSKYKSVNIGLSIDSHIPDQLNYIRYPIDADEILENLQKFKNFFIDAGNVSLNITCTVNPLNIYNIDEIFTELSNYGINVGLNFVSYPCEYDVRILPGSVKSEILNKNLKLRDHFGEFFLQELPSADTYLKKFWQITKDLDSFRNQSFEKLFPDYYQLLAPHL